MAKSIAAVESAVGSDGDLFRLIRVKPAPTAQLERLAYAAAPRTIANDLRDLLSLGGLTPWQWMRGGTQQLIDEMVANQTRGGASSGREEGEEPLAHCMEVGSIDRDFYFQCLPSEPNLVAPVLMWSTNALFIVPVAPSLRSLFAGFAAAVNLWRRSDYAKDERDGALAIATWWEPLTESLANQPIPGVAEALNSIYKEESSDWPVTVPVWDLDDRIDPFWRGLLGIA
ncbi:MAG: hypothetical protein ACYDAL_04745 [Candidatus Dormibacteraceae bacterium]